MVVGSLRNAEAVFNNCSDSAGDKNIFYRSMLFDPVAVVRSYVLKKRDRFFDV